MNQEQKKPWSPITLNELVEVFKDAPFFWCVAGGHAIELAVGQTLRTHGDTDVLVLRRDHHLIHEVLHDWELWVADPPGTLKPWPSDTRLEIGVHDIWCRRGEHWELQVMLDESEQDVWYSRRHQAISRTIEDIRQFSPDGTPYLAPHIQLFYKAKSLREKDEFDFVAVLESGIEFDREWLCTAIEKVYGDDHPWISRLMNTVG